MYAIYVQGTALDTRGIPVNNTGESNNFCTLLAHVLAQQVNYPVGKEQRAPGKNTARQRSETCGGGDEGGTWGQGGWG